MTSQMKRLYACPEAAYSTDPDSDGSDYRWLPAEDVSMPKSMQTPIGTQYATGRPYPTPAHAGPDGGEFSYKLPLFGHTVSGAATASPPATLNVFEERVQHILGGVRTLVGAALAATGASSISVTANAYNPQDLVPVHEASVPAANPRTQWVHVDSETAGTPNVYAVSPTFEATPTTSAAARASRAFEFNQAGGGATDAYHYVDDDGSFTFLGCRITAASIEEDPQQRAMLVVTVAYDRRVVGTKASLPDVGDGPAVPAIIGAGAAVYWNGELVETKSVRVDFQIEASAQMSRTGTNGRAGHRVNKVVPVVTLDPLSDDDYNVAMGAATQGALLLQFGAGILSGTVLNTCCLYLPVAQIFEVAPTDDSGYKRHSLKVQMVDDAIFSAGVARRAFQFSVA